MTPSWFGPATYIYGAGGHGHDIGSILAANHDGLFPSFLDDNPTLHYDSPYMAAAGAHEFGRRRWFYYLGVADPAVRSRMDFAPEHAASAVTHPTATSRAANLADGVVVGAHSDLGCHVSIGRHSHVGALCSITRTVIGEFCQISPRVAIAGDVTIGDRTLVGIGATIKNLVTIGSDVIIGAGAVVVADVPDHTTVVGVPARPMERHPATPLGVGQPLPTPGTTDPGVTEA